MGQDINLDFLDEYNRVDKILKDMYPDGDHSLSGAFQYCEDMRKNAPYAKQIAKWENDRRELDRLRRARNDVSHEPGLLRTNVFTEEDIFWIQDFHHRLLSQTDPLALLRKEKLRSTQLRPTPRRISGHTSPAHRKERSGTGCLLTAIAIIIVVAALLLFFL